MGLNQLTSTTYTIVSIENRYVDPYELGTRRERAYIYSISSVYQEDCIDDVATIVTTTIQKITEVYTQDTEWDLDDLEI